MLLSEGEGISKGNCLEAEVSLASFRNGEQTSAAGAEQARAKSRGSRIGDRGIPNIGPADNSRPLNR